MAGTIFSLSFAPQFADGVFHVTSQFIGQTIIDGIRRQFPQRKTERGDYYVDLTQNILEANLPVIKPNDKQIIEVMFEEVLELRNELDTEGDSRLQRNLKAREFKQLAKQLYSTSLARASDRGKGESLLTQIKQATGAIQLDNRNPFDDPPRGRSFMDSSTDSLESVEVTTYQSSTSEDAAVAITVHEQGGPTQELVARFSPDVLANDRVERGVQTIMVINADQNLPEPQDSDGK